jgi:hypothetical protein
MVKNEVGNAKQKKARKLAAICNAYGGRSRAADVILVAAEGRNALLNG